MSLVTTQMLYSSAILRVRRSMSAVLPDPTGPATPMRTYDMRFLLCVRGLCGLMKRVLQVYGSPL